MLLGLKRLSLKCAWIISLLFVFIDAFGQREQIDSLKKTLATQLADTERVRTMIRLGYQYINRHELELPMALADSALRFADQIGFKVGYAEALMLKGSVYRWTVNEAKGLEYYYQALRILETAGDKRKLAVCYQLLGFSNFWQQNHEAAFDAYRKCLKLSREAGYTDGIIESLAYLSNERFDKRDLEGALALSTELEELSETTGNNRGLGYAYSGFAKYWREKGGEAERTGNRPLMRECLIKSDHYEELAVEQFDQVDDPGAAGDCYNRRAEVHIKLNQLGEAARLLEKARAYAVRFGHDDNFKNYFYTLSNLDSASGDFRNAYAHYKEYITYKERLTDLENARKSQQLYAQYEFEKKEAAVAATQKLRDADAASELRRQKLLRNAFIVGTILLILLIAVLINRQKLKRSIELERMRSRLSRDLHDDIGSTLSSINMLSRTAQSDLKKENSARILESLEKIGERSQRLLTNMSDIIWNISPGSDTLEEVINRMREYGTAVLEAMRIRYTFDFPDEPLECQLSMEVKNNLYLIFKEAMNNLAKYSAADTALIKLTYDEKYIYLKVEDDGIGFDEQTVEHGRGLHNMKHRAEEIGSLLTINAQPGLGTKVMVRVPRYC